MTRETLANYHFKIIAEVLGNMEPILGTEDLPKGTFSFGGEAAQGSAIMFPSSNDPTRANVMSHGHGARLVRYAIEDADIAGVDQEQGMVTFQNAIGEKLQLNRTGEVLFTPAGEPSGSVTIAKPSGS